MCYERLGHESLRTILHFVQILLSVFDHDSTVAERHVSIAHSARVSQVTNRNKYFVFIPLSTRDPTSRFSFLGGKENIAAVRTNAASAIGQMLNQQTPLWLEGCLLVFVGAR